ncbi:MAG: hypothetical protein WC632_06020 [Candidatus Margulisiibacteriota bacterium]
MNSKNSLISHIEELIRSVVVIVFFVGGLGGSVVAAYTEGSFYKNLAAISFLPYFNMLLWQWPWGGRVENWKIPLFKLLGTTLSVVFLVLVFVIPDLAISIGLLAVSISYIIFFVVLWCFWFMDKYIMGKNASERLEVVAILVLLAIPIITLMLWKETLFGSLCLGTYLVLLVAYLFLSTILYIFYKLVGRDLVSIPLFGIKYLNEYALIVGCGIGLTILFMFGLERVLFFLPNDWGYYSDENYHSYRQDIALWGGIAMSGIFIYLLNKVSNNSGSRNEGNK